MNDMSSVIIAKSDQLNADDLISGPITISITGVKIAPGEQPVAISFTGDDGKPWKPCKGMSRVLVAAWGPDAKAYVGRSLTLYRDPKVTWAGMEVGGIRISHLSDIDREMVMALTATRGNKKPFTVRPLVAQTQKPDKAADGVRALIDRLNETGPGKMADAILSSAEVVKQREWLAAKRPELAAQVDACVAALQAADDDPFVSDQPAAGAPLPADADSHQPADEAAASVEQGPAKADVAADSEGEEG